MRVTATTEQRTDEDGNTKEYKILNVTLTNESMTNSLTNEQRELYNIYLVSKGNSDYLFANDIYANETDAPSYTIPGEALTDATFRRLITEAEKYLGYPYDLTMATIEKIEKDIIKTKEKIAELQKKVRTLETQKVEAENLQIVQLVKTVNIGNKELTALLKAYAKGEFELPEEYKAELQEDTDNENEQA